MRQVRCDGNKESCKRCVDKRLTCVYIESRVGKVVGKRRKRPLNTSIERVDFETWAVSQQHVNLTPSSATISSLPDSHFKHHCPDGWPFWLAYESQTLRDSEKAGVTLQSIEVPSTQGFDVSSNTMFILNGDIQTPNLRPSTTRYHFPEATRPMSPNVTMTTPENSTLHTPAVVVPIIKPEDEELICIKLLGHIKKHSNSASRSWNSQVDLLSKSNASVRRILHSREVRRNYSCQLLLSSIMTHLTMLCECLCSIVQEEQKKQDQALRLPESRREPLNMQIGPVHQRTSSGAIQPLLLQASWLVHELGNVLKRNPCDDFQAQAQGRQEAWMLELELRLRAALTRS